MSSDKTRLYIKLCKYFFVVFFLHIISFAVHVNEIGMLST